MQSNSQSQHVQPTFEEWTASQVDINVSLASLIQALTLAAMATKSTLRMLTIVKRSDLEDLWNLVIIESNRVGIVSCIIPEATASLDDYYHQGNDLPGEDGKKRLLNFELGNAHSTGLYACKEEDPSKTHLGRFVATAILETIYGEGAATSDQTAHVISISGK